MTATAQTTEGTLTERLDEATRLVAGVLDELAPELLAPGDAGRLLERFVALGKRCDAGRTLVAARATAGDEWRSGAGRTPEEWLARKTGSTTQAAKATLEASSALEGLSRTADALRAGKLSVEQTAAVASGAAANPNAEAELLTAARTESLAGLKNQVALVRAAADPHPERTRARIHRARAVRFYDDAEGARCGFIRGPRDVMARFEARLQRQREQVFKDARKAGVRDLPDAYTFDALMDLADPEKETASSSKPEMLILADLAPVVDGHLNEGEVVEIPGIGAYPVDAARDQLFGDAIVRLVVRHGVDVAAVVTNSRDIRTAVEAAIYARDRGRCVVPGCGRTHNLEIHHVGSANEFSKTQTTRLDQLALLHDEHHDDVTHRGATLVGTHPDWRYTPADPDKARARDEAKAKKRDQARRRAKHARDHPERR